MINKPYFSQILQFTIQSGDSKAFVAAFAAMERMWLDTTGLDDTLQFQNKLIKHKKMTKNCMLVEKKQSIK